MQVWHLCGKRKEDWVGRIPDCRAASRKVWPGWWEPWSPRQLLKDLWFSQEWASSHSSWCLVTGWKQPAGSMTDGSSRAATEPSVSSTLRSRRTEQDIFMATLPLPHLMHIYIYYKARSGCCLCSQFLVSLLPYHLFTSQIWHTVDHSQGFLNKVGPGVCIWLLFIPREKVRPNCVGSVRIPRSGAWFSYITKEERGWKSTLDSWPLGVSD